MIHSVLHDEKIWNLSDRTNLIVLPEMPHEWSLPMWQIEYFSGSFSKWDRSDSENELFLRLSEAERRAELLRTYLSQIVSGDFFSRYSR
jgi:hypothetical protein